MAIFSSYSHESERKKLSLCTEVHYLKFYTLRSAGHPETEATTYTFTCRLFGTKLNDWMTKNQRSVKSDRLCIFFLKNEKHGILIQHFENPFIQKIHTYDVLGQ